MNKKFFYGAFWLGNCLQWSFSHKILLENETLTRLYQWLCSAGQAGSIKKLLVEISYISQKLLNGAF
jgi:hypothetical protein